MSFWPSNCLNTQSIGAPAINLVHALKDLVKNTSMWQMALVSNLCHRLSWHLQKKKKKSAATSTWWIGAFILQPASGKMKASRMFMESEPLWCFSWGALNFEVDAEGKGDWSSYRGTKKYQIYNSREKALVATNAAGNNTHCCHATMAKILFSLVSADKTHAYSISSIFTSLWHKTHNMTLTSEAISYNYFPITQWGWNYSKHKVDQIFQF